MGKIFFLILFQFFSLLLLAQVYVPGQSYFGTNDYIEYVAGNTPIIIIVPHGGYLTPAALSDRNCSGCVTERDDFTQELSRDIKNSFSALAGCHPHFIINLLDRRKLDSNREIVEAADGDPGAELAWQEYQDFIADAKTTVIDDFGKGLLIDMHGQSHPNIRIELGYEISASQLRLSNATLDNPTFENQTTIKNLVAENLGSLNLPELMRGPEALGSLLEDVNYPTVPSDLDPFPMVGEPYFSGGYTARTHGSRDGGTIDGVMMELNRTGIRDTDTNRKKFADSLAIVLNNFMGTHYLQNEDLCGDALPIELGDWSGEVTRTFSDLKWTTLSESNVCCFYIEHSRDGRAFESIGFQKAQGNYSASQEYSFQHNDPPNGVNYYRLSIEDYDGSVEYSPIISVDVEQRIDLNIFPNPVCGEMVLTYKVTPSEMGIYDVHGHQYLLMSGTEINEKISEIKLELPPGIYYLKYIQNNQVFARRFVKSNCN